MNNHFKLFDKKTLEKYQSTRYGLDKDTGLEMEDAAVSYGQKMELCKDLEQLSQLKATYIIIGVPEDIGVRANLGRVGASKAWEAFLSFFLGLQHTSLNQVDRFSVLGNVKTEDLMASSQGLDASIHEDRLQLSHLVNALDQRVSEIATKIMEAGKTPVVIGGGHNNSFPLLRACGYSNSIDCINLDAHTDLRVAKGRHSGNGFSHAIEKKYLKSYYMIGIQENYLSQPMVDLIQQNDAIDYSSYSSKELNIEQEVAQAFKHIDSNRYTLEIDMDVVAGFPSSAQSPVGYSFQELRNLMNEIVAKATALPQYVHICEAAPRYGYNNQVGKALATLVNDLP